MQYPDLSRLPEKGPLPGVVVVEDSREEAVDVTAPTNDDLGPPPAQHTDTGGAAAIDGGEQQLQLRSVAGSMATASHAEVSSGAPQRRAHPDHICVVFGLSMPDRADDGFVKPCVGYLGMGISLDVSGLTMCNSCRSEGGSRS